MDVIRNIYRRPIPQEGASKLAEITAVLVSPEHKPGGAFAVYIGIGSPEWIVAHGIKCRFHEARVYFEVEETNYR
ncbi:hypothetical protein D3877_23565 [Azospirillum cavernae]|uniref:Uncharacterized protein n=1 Tax=Azospirillum cavernae TaxID=2320860 RepID=A0A418VPE0_9PROT|nr:hypothetical protein [Azospirillum cavernae]RJF78111.1 hypothetical protein D3877_23565 [Azospirillum cavernae]